MAFSYDFCATRILNISRPSGWLDGQKHLRLPPFDARTHSCLAPRVRRNNRTPPQDGLGRCPRGRSQPHRGLRQAHGEEDQCRREEGASPTRDTSPHSVQGYRISSTADTSRRRHLRRMRSGLRCARLGRSRCARALSMRVTSMHRFSGRVAIARGDRNVAIARHPLSSRWWLVNARGFLRRADPNPYPPLPALTIQAFNARALRSGPRDLTVRLRFTARENPAGERVQATTPPPGGPPTCHLSCDKTRADGVRAEDIPRIRFSAAAVRGRRARSRGRRGSTTRGTDAIRRSPRVFVSRSPPDARATPRIPRPSGAPSPETAIRL